MLGKCKGENHFVILVLINEIEIECITSKYHRGKGDKI